ncbi:MAG TPA: hypothetical protein VFO00_09090 [Vitreimonas sp.]|nr:hypothetical protein [Vitreimonas sp.]
MIDVRIVCSHDAVKLAEMLTRLLEAEEHRVRLTYGRQALLELEEAREARDAVLLIWSPDARSQTYMLEWVRNIDPARLVEISRGAHDFHPIKRLAAVIDFTNWRGERGARAWKALTERLGAIARSLAPPAPVPAKALMAMGVASMAAVAGAVVVRVNMPVEPIATPAPLEEIAATDPASGVGGPLNAIEPASLEDDLIRLRHYPELQPLDMMPATPLSAVADYEAPELRDPTLRERFDGALNTLGLRGNEPS